MSSTKYLQSCLQRTKAVHWLWRRASVRRMLRNPLRTITVIVSVALATTLLSAVIKVCTTSVTYFEQGLGLQHEESDLFISPIGGRFKQQDITRCFSTLGSHADIIGIRRESGVLSTKGYTRTVSIAGVSGFGRAQNSEEIADFEMQISPRIRKELQLAEGDAVTITTGNISQSLSVPDGPSRLSTAEEVDVLLPLEQLGETTNIDTVVLRQHHQGTATPVAALSSFLQSCLGGKRAVRVESNQGLLERREELLAAYRLNIAIMAAITLLVCALLISQAAHISIRLQLRELAITRTLGVSQLMCFAVIVIEVALLSFLGALLACTVGYPAAISLTGFLVNTARDIYQVSIEPFGAGYEFILGIGITFGVTVFGALAAALSARKALSLAPYRGTRREQVHNQPLKRSATTCAALASSLFCCVIGALAAIVPGAVVAYVSVGAVLAWVACCTPLTLVLITQSTKHIRVGLAWKLMQGALHVAGRHFVLSGIAASLAIALMVGLQLMVSSFHNTLSRWSMTRLAGDLFVSAALSGDGNEARISEEYVTTIQANPLFRVAIPYFETESRVGQERVLVAGTDIGSQCARAVYTFRQGGCDQRADTLESGVIINESAHRKLDLPLGATVVIDDNSFTITGIIQEFGTERPLIVLDNQAFKKLYPGHNPKTITIDLIDRTRLNEGRAWLNSVAPELLTVRDNAELRELVDTLFTRTFRVTESVRWIVFALAVLGLVSTGVQYIWERRREFKTAAVLGVSLGTLVFSAGLEAGLVALGSLAIGLLGGIAVGWCLTTYINPEVFGWSFMFSVSAAPFVEVALFFMSVLACSSFAGWIVLSKITHAVRLADE